MMLPALLTVVLAACAALTGVLALRLQREAGELARSVRHCEALADANDRLRSTIDAATSRRSDIDDHLAGDSAAESVPGRTGR